MYIYLIKRFYSLHQLKQILLQSNRDEKTFDYSRHIFYIQKYGIKQCYLKEIEIFICHEINTFTFEIFYICLKINETL
jgi:hypothetical protein